MRTLFVLMAFVLSTLVGGMPQADAAPPQTPNGDLCLTIEPEASFPHYFEDDGESMECITILSVTATFTNTSPVQVTLHITGQRWRELDNYGENTIRIDQRREDDTILVSIYRPIAAGVSRATPNPYEETLPLAGSFEPGTYTIRVNEYVFELAIPDAPPPGGAGPTTHPDNQGFVRSYADIYSVEVVLPRTNQVALHITGYHTYSGGRCALPRQIEQHRERDRIVIEIYRLIDADYSCPTEREWVDEYVRLDESLFSGSYLVQVNEYVTEISIPPDPQPIRSYAQIDYVEVLPSYTYDYPARLTLHVVGSFICQEPLRIDQHRSGNWIYLDLYQVLDPSMICPDMLVRLDEYIPLEGHFDYGTYVFQVNDYVLSYTFPIYDELPPPLPLPMPID